MDDHINLTVEFYGTSRQAADTSQINIEIPSDNSVLWSDITTTLLEKLPGLAGKVIEVGSGCLVSSYAINLNGRHFINQEKTAFKDGDVLIIVPSMSGG